MKSSDRQRFAALMAQASETYAKPLTEGGLTLWWTLMRDHTIDDVERAMHAHMLDPERGRFLPVPADLVRIIEGSGGDRAALAWTKVREAIRSIGPYRSVVFDDPVIHAVIEDMGGWIRMGDMSTEEAPFRGKEFSDRYKAYAMRRQAPQHPPMLCGEHDLANRVKFPGAVNPPVLVGDVQRARAILEGGASPQPVERADRAAAALLWRDESSRLNQPAGAA